MYIQVELELSRKCQLECLHCFSESGPGKEGGVSPEEADMLVMRLKEVFGKVGDLYSIPSSGVVYDFIISGGEPSLLGASTVLRLAESLKKAFGEGSRVSMNTNLMNFSALKEIIDEETVSVAVSFDPVIRGWGFPAFERRWLENFAKLDISGRGIPVELTITRYLMEFPLKEFVSTLQVKELGLSPILPMGRAKRYFDTIGVTPREASDCVINAFEELPGDVSITPYGGLREVERVRRVHNVPYRVECWGDCWNRFIVRRDGSVEVGDRCFPDSFCGNIYTDDAYRIFNSPARMKFMSFQLEKSSTACMLCPYNHFCMGGCTLWYFWKDGLCLKGECPGYRRVLDYVIQGKKPETERCFYPKSDFMKRYAEGFFDLVRRILGEC